MAFRITQNLPPEGRRNAILNAKPETILISDEQTTFELYERCESDWRCLTELATAGYGYLTYETWERLSSEELYERKKFDNIEVQLVERAGH